MPYSCMELLGKISDNRVSDGQWPSGALYPQSSARVGFHLIIEMAR